MTKDKTKQAASNAPAEKSEPQVETVEFVEFFGPGREVTQRILNENDFTDDSGEVIPEVGQRVWDKTNNWKIPLEDFRGNIPAIRAFVDRQPDFKITSVERPAPEQG